ncbi:hypothetical protein [Campylobacter helveticus]|uniref:Uncharacterized protein n=1 Tax=Campylobacter helveticus TaxID=28898 RepID=A0AAX2UHT5_9BACT|nr:hypothetical protein [Campylobacter helveticus]MCR2060473.1 hypothetical protein [Campylobacter helveticus]TNB56588.1 hypothetical protein FDW42_07145 [Campylobacter helveticus]TNB57547.1 hypothetical protein FDW44_06845 [Campylobacter helveticus]TNB62887.1 hypothetical protein FDW43_05795 [Campylobacter helveticus]
MGCRAYTVTRYEKDFGDCLGFNYDLDGFCEFVEKLAIEFFIEDDLVELNTNELLSLNPKQLELNEEELELLRSLQEAAARATYAIDGYFRIEWL